MHEKHSAENIPSMHFYLQTLSKCLLLSRNHIKIL